MSNVDKIDESMAERSSLQADDIDYANLKFYGAKGDGVTDDTGAIKSAIDYITSLGGGTLYFPNGIYIITNNFYINCSNFTVCGEGNGSVIKARGDINVNREIFAFNTNADQATNINSRLKNITVKDVTIDQSDVEPKLYEWSDIPSYGGYGAIRISNSDCVKVMNVKMINPVFYGISSKCCSDILIEGNSIDGMKNLYPDGSGGVYGGNAIDVGGYYTNDVYYDFEPGKVRIVNNYVKSSRVKVPFITHTSKYGQGVIWEYANIGIQTQIGSHASTTPTQIDIIVQGNVVENCISGIVAEGQTITGAGESIINANAINECIFGIILYPNIGLGGNDTWDSIHNCYNTIISNNKIKNSYIYGIRAVGENVLVQGNQIADWGLVTKTISDAYKEVSGPNVATAILIEGCNESYTTGIYKNIRVSNNMLAMTKAILKTSSYIKQIGGIRISTSKPGVILSNVEVSDNTLDGAKTDLSTSDHCAGIYISGVINNSSVKDNLIDGFANSAIIVNTYDGSTDYSKTPSELEIKENRLIDNSNAYADNVTIRIKCTGVSGYYILGNSYIFTDTNRDYAFIELTNPLGTCTTSNIVIKDNIINDMKYNNGNYIYLSTKSENVKILSNKGYNNRSSLSMPSVKVHKGTIFTFDVYGNGNPTGFVCTTTGTGCSTAWIASTAYLAGNSVYANNKVYKCSVSGTSGSTAPSHISGSAIDGTVVWIYIDVLALFVYTGQQGYRTAANVKGNFTPIYVGEVVYDTSTGKWLKAYGMANTNWA
ncbi:glycosyl hydrolase family 28-related protein [Clostridium sp. WILCCON 0269]|uniref:Glycosyl hydrolase family 28-related protein n=1 Tax=Candidatus Clostridium eludens TaxID=3381663 RepID=A0ABW8SXL4_9CLOT